MREFVKKMAMGALAMTIHGEVLKAADISENARPSEIVRKLEGATKGERQDPFETGALSVCIENGNQCKVFGTKGSDNRRTLSIPRMSWRSEAEAFLGSVDTSYALPLLHHNHPGKILIAALLKDGNITKEQVDSMISTENLLSGPSPLDYLDIKIRHGGSVLPTPNVVSDAGGSWVYIQKDPLAVPISTLADFEGVRAKLVIASTRSHAPLAPNSEHIVTFIEEARKVGYVIEYLPPNSSDEEILTTAKRVIGETKK